MPSMPNVRGSSSPALYPFVRRIAFDTGVAVQADGSEQRWKRRAPLFSFDFAYNDLRTADRNSVQSVFNTQKGLFATNLSATIPQYNSAGTLLSVTYQNMVFESDEILCEEFSPALWRFMLKCKQTQNNAYTIPSVGSTFPTFSVAVRAQYPLGSGYQNLTSYGDSPSGTRYSYGWYGTGLTGFPTRPLRFWNVSLPMLPDVDAATLENYFTGKQGRLTSFTWPDPDTGTSYDHCRFGNDTLVLNARGVNAFDVSFTIVETNGS